MLTIAAVPTWIFAGLLPGGLFFSYLSIRVESDDSISRPICEFLRLNCNVLLGVREDYDEEMMGSSAWHSIYKILLECPGNEVPHSCSR